MGRYNTSPLAGPWPDAKAPLPSSRGLGHSPLKAGTRVRIPLGAPIFGLKYGKSTENWYRLLLPGVVLGNQLVLVSARNTPYRLPPFDMTKMRVQLQQAPLGRDCTG